LDAMGLQVSQTAVSESLDVIETLGMERFKMLHLSKQIRDLLKKHAVMRQELAAAEMDQR
jgi:hypothetical protein